MTGIGETTKSEVVIGVHQDGFITLNQVVQHGFHMPMCGAAGSGV